MRNFEMKLNGTKIYVAIVVEDTHTCTHVASTDILTVANIIDRNYNQYRYYRLEDGFGSLLVKGTKLFDDLLAMMEEEVIVETPEIVVVEEAAVAVEEEVVTVENIVESSLSAMFYTDACRKHTVDELTSMFFVVRPGQYDEFILAMKNSFVVIDIIRYSEDEVSIIVK